MQPQHPASAKLQLREINSLLTCCLCKGYLIDATTISECLHNFCRYCIVAYLANHQCCPVCEIQVHKTKPLLNLRPDPVIQSIVYKLVPGLYQMEMKRRRLFYAKHLEIDTSGMDPETKGEIPGTRFIYAPDDSISLSLEYTYEAHDLIDEDDAKPLGQQDDKFLEEIKFAVPVRYLSCPAAVCIKQLKKLLIYKFGALDNFSENALQDEFSLSDLAYVARWNQRNPIRLTYKISRKVDVASPARQEVDKAAIPEKKEILKDESSSPIVTEATDASETPSVVVDSGTTNYRKRKPCEPEPAEAGELILPAKILKLDAEDCLEEAKEMSSPLKDDKKEVFVPAAGSQKTANSGKESACSPLDLSQHSSRSDAQVNFSSSIAATYLHNTPRSPNKRGRGQSTQTILSIAESLAHKQMCNLKKMENTAVTLANGASVQQQPNKVVSSEPLTNGYSPQGSKVAFVNGRSPPKDAKPPCLTSKNGQLSVHSYSSPVSNKSAAASNRKSPILFNYITFSQSGQEMCVVGSSTLKGAIPSTVSQPLLSVERTSPCSRPFMLQQDRSRKNILKIPNFVNPPKCEDRPKCSLPTSKVVSSPTMLRIPSVRQPNSVLSTVISTKIAPGAPIKAVKAPRISKSVMFRSPIESRLHELIRNQQLVRKQQQAALRNGSLPALPYGSDAAPTFFRNQQHAGVCAKPMSGASLLRKHVQEPPPAPTTNSSDESSPALTVCEKVNT